MRLLLALFLFFLLMRDATVSSEEQGGKYSLAPWRKIVVLGDVHGDFLYTVGLLRRAGVIDGGLQWIARSETLVVQTGDIVDRGPDSYKIYELFRSLRRQAHEHQGGVLQLFGNHEALNLCQRFHYVHPVEISRYYGGLQPMAKAWSPEGRLGVDVRENFEVAAKVGDFLFVHAGLVPRFAGVDVALLKERFLNQIDNEHCALSMEPPISRSALLQMSTDVKDSVNSLDVLGELGPTWSRVLSMEDERIACPLLKKTLALQGVKVMVVGHTPTESEQIETRCNGLLICVDTGISRFVANSPHVLVLEPNKWKDISVVFDKNGILTGHTRIIWSDEEDPSSVRTNRHDEL